MDNQPDIIDSMIKISSLFAEEDYFEAVCNISTLLDKDDSLPESLAELYFIGVMKMNNAKFKISDSNSIYQKFDVSIQEAVNKNFEDLTKEEQNSCNLIRHCYFPSDTLNFGMNKGKTIEEIINTTPQYIPWCMVNLQHFYITPKDYYYFEQEFIGSNFHVKAFEYLLIKKHIRKKWENIVSNDGGDYNSNYIWRPSWRDAFGSDEEASIAYWNTH